MKERLVYQQLEKGKREVPSYLVMELSVAYGEFRPEEESKLLVHHCTNLAQIQSSIKLTMFTYITFNITIY